MTQAREQQISLDATPFYHCYVRCVRRAYLCGEDRATGENYDHRKQWIVSRIRFLSYVYAIDICAYAIMSNHYHIVLHVNKEKAEGWSWTEVAERWMQLYKGNMLVHRWLKEPDSLSDAELGKVSDCIEEWRERLYDIGWFMRGINEKIARMANEEENCKGRFWEGRYKSQALLDDAALLSCMAYVDLNPVRAAMEKDLASSDFTSIQQRLYAYSKRKARKSESEKTAAKRVKQQQDIENSLALNTLPKAPLMPFDGSSHTSVHCALPFTREDYFALVDMTGRAILTNKRGYIPSSLPKVVQEFGINPDKWLNHVQNFSRTYSYCAGSSENIVEYSNLFERKWAKGAGKANGPYAA